MKRKENGITLVSLVVTIIILLILAGISIADLRGDNGLFAGAKKAKIQSKLSTAKEEVILAINTLMTDDYNDTSKITPKMVADQVNKDNNRDTHAENESAFPTNIIYPTNEMGIGEEILVKVGNNLEIIEVKTASGITDDGNTGNGNTDNGNTGGNGQVSVGNVEITITDVKSKGFTINVNPEKEENIAMYQYYINGQLVHEGTEKQYIVSGLDMNTNYEVEVKAIPKTTVSVGKLQQKTLERPIIELANKFDRYIYIDEKGGNDTTGDGSLNKPYATLDKITDSGIIEKGNSYGVVLNEGVYQLTEKMFNLDYDKEINIVGKRKDTILKVSSIYPNYSGGKTGYKINLYRLIWNGTTAATNAILPQIDMNFYNIALKMDFIAADYSYFMPWANKTFYFYNCTLTQKVTSFLRNTDGTNKLINCYGGFTSGYGTSDNMWNYQTNRILNNYTLGSDYSITEDESVWKNVGTGINPDETQANLGLYGGTYSWDYYTDLD